MEMDEEVVFKRDVKSYLIKAISGTEWMYRRGALERGRGVSVACCCVYVFVLCGCGFVCRCVQLSVSMCVCFVGTD